MTSPRRSKVASTFSVSRLIVRVPSSGQCSASECLPQCGQYRFASLINSLATDRGLDAHTKVADCKFDQHAASLSKPLAAVM